jgi:hypothetical protein
VFLQFCMQSFMVLSVHKHQPFDVAHVKV